MLNFHTAIKKSVIVRRVLTAVNVTASMQETSRKPGKKPTQTPTCSVQH